MVCAPLTRTGVGSSTIQEHGLGTRGGIILFRLPWCGSSRASFAEASGFLFLPGPRSSLDLTSSPAPDMIKTGKDLLREDA